MMVRYSPSMTEQDIKHVCDVLKSKFPDRSLDFYKFGLAQEILRVLINNEWANQAIFEQHPALRRFHLRKEGVRWKTVQCLDIHLSQARLAPELGR